MYRYLKREVNEAQLQLNTLSDIAKSFFPPESSLGTIRRRRSMDDNEPHYQRRRLFCTFVALAAGTGFILGEPIKGATCDALSIFNLCDSKEHSKPEVNQVTKQQKTQQQAFQTSQDQNNEKFSLLRDDF